MFDKMNGNLVGTNRISNAQVLDRFMAMPTDMTMQMHMGMVMYAPTDKLINKPIWQSLDGPQLQRRWVVRLGWQVEFNDSGRHKIEFAVLQYEKEDNATA